MISATEAKKLADRTSVIVNKYIEDNIGPRVKAAAEAGQLQCTLVVDSDVVYISITPTPFQNDVMWKLATLGYRVAFGRIGEEYVIVDDDDTSTTYKNYGYKISWE